MPHELVEPELTVNHVNGHDPDVRHQHLDGEVATILVLALVLIELTLQIGVWLLLIGQDPCIVCIRSLLVVIAYQSPKSVLKNMKDEAQRVLHV